MATKYPPKSSLPSSPEEQKYQAQDDVRTLMNAHAIHGDKARHGRAKAHAKDQLAALKGVTNAPPTLDTSKLDAGN